MHLKKNEICIRVSNVIVIQKRLLITGAFYKYVLAMHV